MIKTFRKYLENFMKIFLDDFTVYGKSFVEAQTMFSKVQRIWH
jgi:hypothetical protein